MIRIRYIGFILLIISCLKLTAFAQQENETDSLLMQYNLQTADYLINLAREGKIYDFDSARDFLISAKKMADSLRNTKEQISTLISLGHLYFDNAFFEDAEETFSHILINYSNDLNDSQFADVKHSLGLNNIRFNNYDQAISNIQDALIIYEKNNNRKEIARALKDFGVIYYYLGNKSLALENYQKALSIYREVNDSDGIARTYNNIGMIFKENGNIKQALDYLSKSLEIKEIQGNIYGIANTLGNIGDVYMANSEFDRAIEYFNKALNLYHELNYLNGICEIYNYLGEVYLKKKEYQIAVENLNKAHRIALENNFKQRLIVTSKLLADAYLAQYNYKEAFENYTLYSSLKDSMYITISEQKIEEYLARYENMKAEKELAEQDKQIIRQRYMFIMVLFVLFATFIFLIILIRQNRSIRRKSNKMQKINRELDLRVHQKTSELRISQFSIDIASDAIFWMKKNGEFVYVNNSAALLLDYTRDELKQKSIFEIVPEFSNDIWEEYWDQLKKKGSYVIQLYFKTHKGTEIPVEAAFNFREFEGDEYNFIYSRNISDRKISEEKLKNAKDRAERSNKLKSAFLANMSHEIRTPMNAIIGFIQLLGDRDIHDSQKQEIIALAQSSGNDLLNIINDIIDISKIEADELNINKSLIYVNQLMVNIYKVYLNDSLYRQKEELELKLELEPESERFAIFTDQSRFRQVMNNFLSNAVKFTEQGNIVLGYKKINAGGRKLLKFYVRDTGIGISKEKQEFVFDRFNQLIENRTKEYKGSGLGLAISKKLIELLGGEIGVTSEEGAGSEFYFTLPFQMMDAADVPAYSELKQKQKIDWSDKALLIVEDTPSNYYLIENYLKPTHIALYWAKTGKEAIDLFKQQKNINLVLMDIQLPGINGYEATRLIKAHNQKIPVIAQTAYALAGEKEISLNEGCDDYIPKPIKKELLIDLLSKYL
ncbi:MAG TPA: tetratricopeptide repeat protein [Bacteroidales bacterium]|nr:tetratricopeptide repeat protein [Bacteroidales bacterium]